MLDFFTIFSKGGILLWCFKGADLLQKDWDAFTPAVNSFIKTVLLQVTKLILDNYYPFKTGKISEHLINLLFVILFIGKIWQ